MRIIFDASYPDCISYYGDTNYDWGRAVAGQGDVNGDGYSDLLVTGISLGAQRSMSDTPRSVAVLYYGGPRMDTIPDFWITANREWDTCFFGAFALLADVNGDGYSELLIGAPYWHRTDGELLIFPGGPSLDTIPEYVIRGHADASGRRQGVGMSFTKGDVYGDGYDDLIQGVVVGGTMGGRSEILYGGPDFDTIPDHLIYRPDSTAVDFGELISSGGDVNGDGFDDIVVTENTFGRVLLYRGGGPPDSAPFWIQPFGTIGDYVEGAIVPDLNGDGYDEIVLCHQDCGTEYGKIEVFLGGETLSHTPALTLYGNRSRWLCFSPCGGRMGRGQRGFLAVGVEVDSTNYVHGVVAFDGAEVLDTVADAWAMYGPNEAYGFGFPTKCAGDVDGDGWDELIASMHGASTPDQRVRILDDIEAGISESNDPRLRTDPISIRPLDNPGTGMFRFPVKCRPDWCATVRILDAAGRLAAVAAPVGPGRGFGEFEWRATASDKRIPPGVYTAVASDGHSNTACRFVLVR